MSSLVESVSSKLLLVGVGPAVLVILAFLLSDNPWSPAILGMTLVFCLVIAVRGVRPFGDTIAYGILLSVGLTLWAVTFLVVEGPDFLSIILTVLGILILLLVIRRGLREGFWRSVHDN